MGLTVSIYRRSARGRIRTDLFIGFLKLPLFLLFCSMKNILTLNWQQDDDNALLQQALAMSMDDPASSHDLRDTDMSEAAADDPDLALGEFSTIFWQYFIRLLVNLSVT